MTKIAALALVLLALSGCAHMQLVVRDYCELHKPGQASRQDTQGTKNWFDNDRAFYRRRCL